MVDAVALWRSGAGLKLSKMAVLKTTLKPSLDRLADEDGIGDAELRLELVMTYLMGLVIARYRLKLDRIAAADREDLVTWYGPPFSTTSPARLRSSSSSSAVTWTTSWPTLAPAGLRRWPRTRSPRSAASRTWIWWRYFGRHFRVPAAVVLGVRGGASPVTVATAERGWARGTTASIISHTSNSRTSSLHPSASSNTSTVCATQAEALAGRGCLTTSRCALPSDSAP